MWLSAEDFVGTVYDVDEGRPVPRWVRVDPEAGLVEAVSNEVADGEPVLYLAKGRFRIDLRPRITRFTTAGAGADQCARCPSRMTLPGDDLCAVCRAREQGRTIRVEPVENLLVPRSCDNRCGRQATWSVADETPASPQQATGTFTFFGRRYKDPMFKRAAVVARRWYCSWCYRPPRIVDAAGEVVQEIDTNCRPT